MLVFGIRTYIQSWILAENGRSHFRVLSARFVFMFCSEFRVLCSVFESCPGQANLLDSNI